jgi:hypothetical protein
MDLNFGDAKLGHLFPLALAGLDIVERRLCAELPISAK